MTNVSVIIPTLNPSIDEISSSIKVLRKSIKNPVIILIDSSSSDKSFYNLADKIITINRAEFNHGATRNLAAQLAIDEGADILVFMTQDVIVKDENALSLLVEPLIGHSACAAYGRQLPRPEAVISEQYARYHQYGVKSIYRSLNDKERLDVNMFRFSNVFSAICSKDFIEVGGFSTSTILNEDMLLAASLLRRNKTVAYIGNAEVEHSHNYNLKEQFKRNFDIGVSMKDADNLLKGASVGREGILFALGQINYAIRKKQLLQVPYIILELAMRWFGLQFGMRHNNIPVIIKKKLSMHSYHWDQYKETP